MPQFTLGQKKAHDHQRHVSITANAGSGKTSVLVSRYCDLIEYRGYEPGEIAAITFTEKAAAELRSRIAREIESRLGDPSHAACWDRLKRVREKFPSAVVTTIHGFCAQVLREFPIDLGVSPNFAVISGFERTEMEEASLMEAIELALADDPEERFEKAYDTVRRIGRELAETILRGMLRNRETLTLMWEEEILGRDPEVRIDEWNRRIERAVRDLTLNASTRPLIDLLISRAKEQPRERAEMLLDRADRAVELDDFLSSFTSLLGVLLTKAGGIRKKTYDLDAEVAEELEDAATGLTKALKSAEKLLAADPSEEIHRTLLHDTDQLFTVAEEAAERYRERKEKVGGLDFEDLQLLLYHGLRDDDAAGRISGRFRYIMVDEFQDTNGLQYRIVREMARNLQASDLLCIVGDRKQSIYGFRGAEVEVFARATEEFMRVNRDENRGELPLIWRTEEIEPDSRDEALGEIALNASFRLLPGICAFVNAACAPLMRPSGTSRRVGVEYEPLVCARQSEGEGQIEFLLAPLPEDPEDPDLSPEITEACLIARRVSELVSSAEAVVWDAESRGEPESARAPRWGDIAILCRKRSTFEHIEEEFRRLDIPYLTHGSSGFFRTQEVYDVVNYLRTLLNYRDDVALLGLLRSPFFAISDIELYRIVRQTTDLPRGSDLWDRVTAWVDRGDASEPLRRAITMVRDDQAMAGRVPVSLLLKRIVERTGWRGAVIGAERGDQMLANVDKLIDLARDFESRGFTNLFDFVERVGAQIDLEEMESEAEINSNRDAVRLMTMHGAKGLEFPIVILPSLESPPRRSTPPFLDRELGYGWNWSFNGEDYAPMITAVMGAREREREEAEEARLFYVALTRARDMLILSGSCDDEPTGATMLAWGFEPVRTTSEFTGEFSVPELTFLKEDGETLVSRDWSQSVRILRSLPAPEQPELPEQTDRTLPRDFLQIGEIPARARGEIYSATQFLVYTQCRTRYYLRYRLGIPETISEAWGESPFDGESEDGTTVARLFRTAVAEIDRIENDEDLVAHVDNVLVLEPLDEETRRRVRTRLLEMLRPIRFDRTVAEQAGIGSAEVRTALELRAPIPYGGNREYVLGVIDRVYRDDTSQQVRFLQFKTLRLRGRDPSAIAESYRPQIRLYAWLLAGLYPEQRSITGTIFFADAPEESREMSFARFDLMRAEEEFRTTIEDIRSISYAARQELPLATPHCPICPYFVEQACLLARGRADGRAEAAD